MSKKRFLKFLYPNSNLQRTQLNSLHDDLLD